MALVGASWGGLVAAAYAARHPGRVTKLVLLDAAPLDFTEFLAGQQRFSAHVSQLQRAGLIPDPVPADRDDSCLPSVTASLPAYLTGPTNRHRQGSSAKPVPPAQPGRPTRRYATAAGSPTWPPPSPDTAGRRWSSPGKATRSGPAGSAETSSFWPRPGQPDRRQRRTLRLRRTTASRAAGHQPFPIQLITFLSS